MSATSKNSAPEKSTQTAPEKSDEVSLTIDGVEVTVLDDRRCIDMMTTFVAEHPDLWHEDIGAAPAG